MHNKRIKKRISTRISAILFAALILFTYLPVFASARTFPHVEEFLNIIAPMAQKDMRENGILASFTIAQAMYESDYGRSRLAKNAKNLFGIKAYSSWKKQVYCTENDKLYSSLSEAESILGRKFMQNHKESFWRAYPDWQASINDRSDLFNTADRYENLRGERDYKQACINVVKDGYCSDYGYAETLIKLIEENTLYRFDDGEPLTEVIRIDLSDEALLLPPGAEFNITATVFPSTAKDKTLTFKSTNTKVVTVDERGNLKTLAAGDAEIIVTAVNGVNAKCTVTVAGEDWTGTRTPGVMTGDVFIRPSPKGDYENNFGVAKTGVSVVVLGEEINGFYFIECKNDSGKLVRGYVYTTKVRLEEGAQPPKPSPGFTLDKAQTDMTQGDIITLTGSFDGNKVTDLVWESDNEEVCRVKDGRVYAFEEGLCIISAKYGDKKATCAVKVKAGETLDAVIVENVNLRRELSSKAGSNGIADAGTEVKVVGEKRRGEGGEEFYFVICDNTRQGKSACGYVLAECLKIKEKPKPVFELNIENTELFLGEISKVVPMLDKVPVSLSEAVILSENPDIINIIDGKIFAFGVGKCIIKADYKGFAATVTVNVTDAKPHKNAFITDNVNLRKDLSTKADSNGIVNVGEKVVIVGDKFIGEKDNFYFVICENTREGKKAVGYVLEQCLRIETPDIKPLPDSGLESDGEFLSGVKPGTSVEALLALLEKANISVFNAKAERIEGKAKITTGSVLISGEKKLTVVVCGDVNSDGKLTAADAVAVKKQVLSGNAGFTKAEEKAADVNGDKKLTAADAVKLKKQILIG